MEKSLKFKPSFTFPKALWWALGAYVWQPWLGGRTTLISLRVKEKAMEVNPDRNIWSGTSKLLAMAFPQGKEERPPGVTCLGKRTTQVWITSPRLTGTELDITGDWPKVAGLDWDQHVKPVECSFNKISSSIWSPSGGPSAGTLTSSGRQQPVTLGGRNVGKGRVREGVIVSPRLSLSAAFPCSLSWWPRSPAQRQAVSHTKQTTSVAKGEQNRLGAPRPPSEEAGSSSRFRIPFQERVWRRASGVQLSLFRFQLRHYLLIDQAFAASYKTSTN